MGDRSGSGWDVSMPKIQTIRKVIRQPDQRDRDEDQQVLHRGWQKNRKNKPAEASNPPAPSRPPYGYVQQVFSDPGPQTGQNQDYGSSHQQAAGWPPPPPNQHLQGQFVNSGTQQSYYQPQQGSTCRPQNGTALQPSFQASYGHNQQAYSGSPPPSSAQYTSYNHGYQSPPQSSDGHQQGNQSSQPYSSSAAPYSQGINHNTISNSYGGSYTDPSLGRIANAPAAKKCYFNLPDDGSCTGCNYHDRYGRPLR